LSPEKNEAVGSGLSKKEGVSRGTLFLTQIFPKVKLFFSPHNGLVGF
jgi:hypothetical protein